VFDYAWKNILARRVRTVLTCLGVAVCVGLVIATSGILGSQTRLMEEHAAASVGKLYVQSPTGGRDYPPIASSINEREARQILARDDLQEHLSTPALFVTLVPPPYPNNPPQVLVAGIDMAKEQAYTGSIAEETHPLQGVASFAESDDLPPRAVILGTAAHLYYESQEGHNLSVGDSISILGESFEIIGILDTSADAAVDNSVLMPLPVAQAFFGREGTVSAVLMAPRSVSQVPAIAAELQDRYPRLEVVTQEVRRQNAEAGIAVFRQFINVVNTAVVVAATLMVLSVMLMAVNERTKEIGTLRAIGAQRGIVLATVLGESFILSLAGCALGATLSSFILRYALAENLFDLGLVLRVIPIGAVISVLSGLYPAWNATRVNPLEALRTE
jgi:putative ABC transport system permease protein